MDKERDYLIELDQQNGDGDLGISMSNGFGAVLSYIQGTDESDLGKIFMKSSAAFNEAAPSSLGTILSFGMIGIAKALKGKDDATFSEMTEAMDQGVSLIMEKAGSKPGEKTVLDALVPAVDALKSNLAAGAQVAFSRAAEAAAIGSESTKTMLSVHGRAAYYGDKSIGLLDGGSVAGKLIVEAISAYLGGGV
ncbi:MAG: dihydroxyacetone kinase subunit L [Clostridia bacterium]|nr:dihydroxyacetone kinase subunit L [Clostridia bacterium]